MNWADRAPRRLRHAALPAIGVLGLLGAGVLWPGAVSPKHQRVVTISGMAFDPAALEVERGDTVVWINRDIVPHTATDTLPNGWDTGTLTQGQTGRFVPRRRGEVKYFCRFHPTMQGKLIIR
ncbi:MAG: cupredoxin family copper-binding protein [Gemmatimonadota bacterium]